MTDKTLQDGAVRKLEAHIWEREANEHYVEPEWCSRRLFEEEDFRSGIWDPACGFGTIPKAAGAAGIDAIGTDLIDRGYAGIRCVHDFLGEDRFAPVENIVTNPPFNIADKFAAKALRMARDRVAIIFPTARLNAAHWLRGTPLKAVWLMTPRPSMPPGHVIARGEKPGGGKMDYCWLLWQHGHLGDPSLRWLRRDVKS